jgi:predicted DNA-binding protein
MSDTLIDRLEKLAAHLDGLDSASGEAKLLREAVAKIESMEDAMMAMSDSLGVLANE